MVNFKQFLQKQIKPKAIQFNSASTAISIKLLSSSLVTSKEKADEFSREVTNLASEDAIMTELSEKLGIPHEAESEEEFVSRGKQTLKEILMSKMIKNRE